MGGGQKCPQKCDVTFGRPLVDAAMLACCYLSVVVLDLLVTFPATVPCKPRWLRFILLLVERLKVTVPADMPIHVPLGDDRGGAVLDSQHPQRAAAATVVVDVSLYIIIIIMSVN